MRSFPVRHYDCDAYGHLNNISYVHYLHEARLQLDAAAGAPPDHLCRTTWLDVEYLQPVRYGDTVEVNLVAAVRDGASLRRAFEFRVHGSDGLAATAQIETEGQPASLSAGWPAGNGVQREELPPLPAPPPGVFTIRRRVSWKTWT